VWQLAIGILYVLLVLFLPYGIVGTWKHRNASWQTVWRERIEKWTATPSALINTKGKSRK
jgi:branched-chain amino acid transport system permease protein